jgi:hypothetical protein
VDPEIIAGNEDGLVALYHFNNQSEYGENDTRVYDFSGNNNHGTVINATWNSTGGILGTGAFMFDGGTSQINVSYSSSLVSTNKTIAFWINLKNLSGTSYLINYFNGYASSDGTYNNIRVTSSKIYVNMRSGGANNIISCNTDLLNDRWHHIVWTYNNSNNVIYLDGNLCNINTKTGDLQTGTRAMLIGNSTNGSIDEVSIWNRSLSAEEVYRLYSMGVNEGDAINLTGCGDLTYANTTYYLNNNVTSTGTCFNVLANNVTLDCNGYTINYSSAGVLGYGVNVNGYNWTTVRNCVVREGTSTTNGKSGIYFNGVNNGTIMNNVIITTGLSSNGIYIRSNYCEINGNQINTSGNFGDGIYVYTAHENLILNNLILATGGGDAISIQQSSLKNTLKNNSLTNIGMIVEGTTPHYPLIVSSSSFTNLTHNRLYSTSKDSLVVDGNSIDSYNHSIDSTNLVNDNPVNYTFNSQNMIYDNLDYTDYGQVIFAWSNNITVSRSNFSNSGLSFYNVHESTINNNKIDSSNGYGIFASRFNNNSIVDNNITSSGSNSHALFFLSSALSNNLTGNLISATGSGNYGMFFRSGSDLRLVNNSVSCNGSSSHPVSFASVNGAIIDGNSFHTHSGDGVRISSLNNSIFRNNNVSSSSVAIRFRSYSNVINNTFIDNKIFSTSTTLIRLVSGNSGFNFLDNVFNSTGNDLLLDSAVTGSTFNFTNVTRSDGSPITINWQAGAEGTLNMHWYLDANVTSDSLGGGGCECFGVGCFGSEL